MGSRKDNVKQDAELPGRSEESPGSIASPSGRLAQAKLGDQVLRGARRDAEFLGDMREGFGSLLPDARACLLTANYCAYRRIAPDTGANTLRCLGCRRRRRPDLAAPAAHAQSGRTHADRHNGLGQPAGIWPTGNFATIARKRTQKQWSAHGDTVLLPLVRHFKRASREAPWRREPRVSPRRPQ
jgi:hypothetical protein